ncbi:Thioredoxin [Melia azedarach]|uniref:Thioredoxin n=1 Tax=Melia azedarach TaxID=155640 RepID=A0ACC1YEX7_MELAZ|nr:Thioredoxin [Melia azedarach]
MQANTALCSLHHHHKIIKMSLLQFSSTVRSPPSLLCTGKHQIASSPAFCAGVSSSRNSSLVVLSRSVKDSNKQQNGAVFTVRSSLETAGATIGQVTEVNKDTFWPIVKAAGDKIVVLDMYTQWCGPCKVMAPKFQELSEKYSDVIFLKLDCNQENKSLAKELGIRVVPTFKILKDNKVVKEVTGAKLEDLVFAIEAVRSS